MEEEQIKVFADSLWDYLLEKKLKQYLSDSVCYYMASVVEPASDGFITVQRPFDNPVTLPCGANAESLAVGDACAVLVFGDFSNQIVIGNVAELTGKITITDATETTLNGVLAGNGETVEAIPVDTVPTAGSHNLVESGGTADAIAAVKGLAQSEVIPSNADLDDYTTPGVYSCGSATTAATLTNCPSASSPFTLTVTDKMVSGASPKRVIQLFVSGNRIFSRGLLSTGWSAWVDYYTISGGTPTTLSGVLSGNGSTVSVMPVDAVPTAGSSNLVTSDGVKIAIDAVGGLDQSTAIASGTDLDTLTTPGAYHCPNSTVAATLINCPFSSLGFSLLVTRKSSGVYPEQLIISAMTMFTRARVSGGWSAWSMHGNTENLQSTITASGVLQGDGNGGVTAKAVDSTPTANSTNLVTSGGVQSALTRPNLLDNWLFVGGGSQLGEGIFPINERGLTSYSRAYCIDRWRTVDSSSSSVTIAVQADGVKITHTTTTRNWIIYQNCLVPDPVGKTFTASILVKEVSGTRSRLHIAFLDASGTQLAAPYSSYVTAAGLYQITAEAPANTAKLRIGLYPGSAPTVGDYVVLTAAKLELGDAQTLAHQENGEWVLNELPNYEEQLIRCKSSMADSIDTYANDEVMFQSMLHFDRPNWTMTGGKVFKITFPAYYRGIIYTFGSSVAAKSEIMVSSTSGSTVSYASVLAGSGMSVAASGATLTLTNTTASTYIYVFIDTFSDVQPTWEEVTT